MFAKTLAASLLLLTIGLAGAASAQPTSMYIRMADTCTGSYCDAGDVACMYDTCIDTRFIAMSCDVACQEVGTTVCERLPHTCEAVSTLMQTPVGTCTYAYCDWEGVACVEIDTADCVQYTSPAACVGSLCEDEGLVCVWSQANPEGDCQDLTVQCSIELCQITALNADTGACVGNPQSYDYDNPPCNGGIACVDMPTNRIVGDFCFLIYAYA